MPRLLRVALPVGALAVIGGLALAWVATRAPSPNAPCGANTTSDYLTAVMAPAQGIAMLNDDFTPREFVVQVLKAVFRMNETHVSFPKIPSGTDSRREAESSHHSDRCL